MLSAIDECLDELRKAFDDIDSWIHVPFFELLVSIPEGNENDLYDLGGKYGDAASLHSTHSQNVSNHLNDLYTSWSGDGAAQAARDSVNQYMQQISQTTQALSEMEKLVNDGASEIEATKFMAIMSLVMLLITLIQVIMTLIVSFGATAAEGAGAIAFCRQALSTALKSLLNKLRAITVKGLLKVALKRALQFAAFTALSKGGIYVIQSAEGHNPTWDWKSFAGEMLDSLATGFIGGPLTVGMHGPLAEAVAMGGGQIGDNAFKKWRSEALGDSQWAKDWGLYQDPSKINLMDGVGQSMLFGAVMAGGNLKDGLPKILGTARADLGLDNLGLDNLGLGRLGLDNPDLVRLGDDAPEPAFAEDPAPGYGDGNAEATEPQSGGALDTETAPSTAPSQAGDVEPNPAGGVSVDERPNTVNEATPETEPAGSSGSSAADEAPAAGGSTTTESLPTERQPVTADVRSGTADQNTKTATVEQRTTTTDRSTTATDERTGSTEPRTTEHEPSPNRRNDTTTDTTTRTGDTTDRGSGDRNPGDRATDDRNPGDRNSTHRGTNDRDTTNRDTEGQHTPDRSARDDRTDPTDRSPEHRSDDRTNPPAREKPRFHEWQKRIEARLSEPYDRRIAEQLGATDSKTPLRLDHDMVNRLLDHKPEDLNQFGRRLRGYIEQHFTEVHDDGTRTVMNDAQITATLTDLGRLTEPEHGATAGPAIADRERLDEPAHEKVPDENGVGTGRDELSTANRADLSGGRGGSGDAPDHQLPEHHGRGMHTRDISRTNQDVFDNGTDVPITADAVRQVAEAMGIDLGDAKVHLVDDPEEIRYLDHMGAGAVTWVTDAGDIEMRLGPAAFADSDSLAATVAHEFKHVEQFRESPLPGSDTRLEREEEAYATEPAALERFRQNFEGWHDDSVRGGDGLRSSVDQGRDGGGGSAAGGDGEGAGDATRPGDDAGDPGEGSRTGDVSERSGDGVADHRSDQPEPAGDRNDPGGPDEVGPDPTIAHASRPEHPAPDRQPSVSQEPPSRPAHDSGLGPATHDPAPDRNPSLFDHIDPNPPPNLPHAWPADPVSGYVIQARDLDFVGLTRTDVEAWMTREAPLGMSPEAYREWRISMLEALARDGIDPAQVDIRMRGSGADFFSGVHKELPSEEMLADNPDAVAKLREWLGEDPNRPVGRPFDSMYKLGLDEPSDFDLNISSGEMFDRARETWDPTRYNGELSKDHGYLNKDLVREEYPHLYRWGQEWTARTGRDMSYAVFDQTGPKDSTHLGFHVHFQETDWIVQRPDPEPGAPHIDGGEDGPTPAHPDPTTSATVAHQGPVKIDGGAVAPDAAAERTWSSDLSHEIVTDHGTVTTSEAAKGNVIRLVTDRMNASSERLVSAGRGDRVDPATLDHLGDGDYVLALRNRAYPSMGGDMLRRSELDPANPMYAPENLVPLDAPGAEHLLREMSVSELLMEWAHDSNGTNIRSLAIQDAAIHEFGLRDVRDWTMTEELRANVEQEISTYSDVHQELLRVQYGLTQQALARDGINSLVLYRGYSWPADRPAWSQHPSGTVIDMPSQRPLSAWTGDRRVAADWLTEHENPGVIIAARFPREAILAFPQTGIGCLWQIEFVVLAGGGRATLDIVHEVTER